MDKAYTIEKELDMCSVDFTGHWQPGAIFRAMQDASNAHCTLLHLTYEELLEQGLVWMMTRARLCMDEYPRLDEQITIKTWPGVTRHTIFPRHYVFERDGKELGRSTAIYVLIDLETRKIALPSRLNRDLPKFDIPAPLPMPGNIATLEGTETNAEYRPVYTDLDMNRHVNNTRYVDWFMNQFSFDKHEKNELAELLIHYNFEVRPDEALTLATKTDGDLSVMRGLHGDQMCFAVQGTWRER